MSEKKGGAKAESAASRAEPTPHGMGGATSTSSRWRWSRRGSGDPGARIGGGEVPAGCWRSRGRRSGCCGWGTAVYE